MDQIKTYESLMRDLEEEPKQKESDKPKKQYKQKPNSFLLDKINTDIKNQKRLTNHYKSKATGSLVVQEDDNVRLISSNQSLDSSLENQFNFLMSIAYQVPERRFGSMGTVRYHLTSGSRFDSCVGHGIYSTSRSAQLAFA